jgi:hypothetical protein
VGANWSHVLSHQAVASATDALEEFHIRGSDAADVAALARLGDVLVFNYGLHYDLENAEQELAYRSDVESMVSLLSPLAAQRGKAVLYRETGAQHFKGTGAFHSWDQAHITGNRTCQCLPMSREVESSNKIRRFNDMAKAALAAHGASEIQLQPFYDFTQKLHYAHEENFCAFKHPDKQHERCCDCSHFCFTPAFTNEVIASMHDSLALTRVRDLH